MPNQWAIDLSAYGISADAYQEMKYFCRQYAEKQRKLSAWSHQDLTQPDPTTRSFLTNDLHLIEQTARQTDPTLAPWILKAVTRGASYPALHAKGIPCGEKYFSKRRRQFFCLLAKKKHLL